MASGVDSAEIEAPGSHQESIGDAAKEEEAGNEGISPERPSSDGLQHSELDSGTATMTPGSGASNADSPPGLPGPEANTDSNSCATPLSPDEGVTEKSRSTISSSDEEITEKSERTPRKRKSDHAELAPAKKKRTATEEPSSESEAGRPEPEDVGEPSPLWQRYFPDRLCPPLSFYIHIPKTDDRRSEAERIQDVWPL